MPYINGFQVSQQDWNEAKREEYLENLPEILYMVECFDESEFCEDGSAGYCVPVKAYEEGYTVDEAFGDEYPDMEVGCFDSCVWEVGSEAPEIYVPRALV